MTDLRLGDCLEVMKSIPDGSIDAIITDPPYGTTACKWDSVIDFELMWEQLNRIVKPNGAIVLFGSEPFSSALRMSNIKNYKYDWIWKKPKGTGHLNAKRMPMNDFENISVFYKKQCTYNPQFTEGKPYKSKSGKSSFEGYGKDNRKGNDNNGKRYPKRLLEFNVVERNTLHSTQKPILLMEYLIKTYTNENETVLDFTMGSGSTGVAAKNLNRSFIGIELDDKYFEIAKERISKEEKQLNIL
jgi:DNA modification methylase|tara:strand:- start:39 stop:767 length:729 start_codon:yes stop_codon:yes gene_type:complete